MISHTIAAADQPSRWERPLLAAGGLAGAMFLGSMALFIGLIAPQMPPIEAAVGTKAAFYAVMAASPLYTAIRFLILAQLAPLALFFGGLYPLLRRAEGGSGALATAVFAAGMFSALLAPIAELVEGHLLLGLSSAGADPLVAVGFDGMTPVAFSLSGLPQLVVLVGVGVLLGDARRLPAWLCWCGYATGLLGLLSVGVMVAPGLFFLGLLSAMLFKLWMIAVSVTLLRAERAERRAGALEPAR